MTRLLACLLLVLAAPAAALERFVFDSIDGGQYDSADWAGRPVLVVNTASLCGFTPQYDGLQALHERYGERGLIVLAVPSDNFNQELESDGAVKDFCEVNFGLTMPMTVITDVTGRDAHPFYRWMAREHGFQPRWNFNKVLIAPDGTVAATYGSRTRPMAPALTRQIEAMLGI